MFKQSSSELLNSLSVIFFSVLGCLNNVAAYNVRIQFPTTEFYKITKIERTL